MSTTEITRPREAVTLFNGAGPDDIAIAAGAVATRFSDIVKQQRMFKRIGDRDHILIEAWQTIGTLTGCFAVDDGRGVRVLPWPSIEGMVWVADVPPLPGTEPRNRDSDQWRTWKVADELRRRYEHQETIIQSHTLGRDWGYVAGFNVQKGGEVIGWGEGRVDRGERTWAGRDDYALSSMAQTRGQSRALGAPLRFIVKLAGYEPTLPDDDPQEPAAAPPAPDLPYGPVTDDDAALKAATESIATIAGVDGAPFIVAMGQHFDGIPVTCVTMLRGLARFVGDARSAAQPDPASGNIRDEEGVTS